MTTISIRMSESAVAGTTPVSITSTGRRIARWLQSTWCVINGGHFKVLHTEPERMALRCVACGHMSPGWHVGSPRLGRTIASKPERLRGRRAAAA
jgi:hypothetical protein